VTIEYATTTWQRLNHEPCTCAIYTQCTLNSPHQGVINYWMPFEITRCVLRGWASHADHVPLHCFMYAWVCRHNNYNSLVLLANSFNPVCATVLVYVCSGCVLNAALLWLLHSLPFFYAFLSPSPLSPLSPSLYLLLLSSLKL
jgi:hypothetical protein